MFSNFLNTLKNTASNIYSGVKNAFSGSSGNSLVASVGENLSPAQTANAYQTISNNYGTGKISQGAKNEIASKIVNQPTATPQYSPAPNNIGAYLNSGTPQYTPVIRPSTSQTSAYAGYSFLPNGTPYIPATSGTSGLSGTTNSTPSGGSSGAVSGATGAPGGSAFTGLIKAAGGIGTPSLVQPGTDTEEDSLETRLQKSFGTNQGLIPTPFSPLIGGVTTPAYSPRLNVPSVGNEFNAGDLTQSAQNNVGALQTREAQSLDDRAETFNQINNLTQDNFLKQPPTPEIPVVDTQEQIDFLNQFPVEQQTDFRRALDEIRNQNGLPQLESQKIQTLKELNSTNEAFAKITDDIKNNPDLPKGLAFRRIQEVQKVQKERILQLTGQLDIIGQQINSANELVNREFQIQKLESDERNQKTSNDRQLLQLMISSGAIGGFNSQEAYQWSTRTGIPVSAINQMIKASQQPNVKVEGNVKDGFVKIITDKSGNIKVEQIAGGNVTGGFETATALRKEFDDKQTTKQFTTVTSNYSNVINGFSESQAGNKIAGDQAIINGFNKLLDPTSVVREAEYARTEQGQSIINQLLGTAEKVATGGAKLSDADRNAMVQVTKRLYADYVRIQNSEVARFRELGSGRVQNLDDIARYIPTAGIIDPQTAKDGDILILDGAPYRKQGSGFVEVESRKQSQSNEPVDQLANAIAQVESSGKYTAVGPANSKGQKAYGKYQVMDFNIPSWTQEALGRAFTVQEFLNNPQAQDAVAKYKLNQYLQQYGDPAIAASLWFSGKPNVNSSAKDVTGTTVPQYVMRVVNELKNG